MKQTEPAGRCGEVIQGRVDSRRLRELTPVAVPGGNLGPVDALARFTFPAKNGLAFFLISFRFVPFIAFVIPLYLLFQKFRLYNPHAGLILAYQLITLPFTISMLRSFFQASCSRPRKRRRSSPPCRSWC